MKVVDARGLSCPEPIMLTTQAMKETKDEIKVLVSEPVQRTNVEKCVKNAGRKAETKAVGSEFEIIIM